MYVYNILKNISPFGVGGKINETVKAIILAAGEGSRMKSKKPKVLMKF